MYASDRSGLSDPYVKVSFNRYSVTTRVVKESVCPTWDQTIVISQIMMYGEPETMRDSPPPVFLQFYDKDTVVSLNYLNSIYPGSHRICIALCSFYLLLCIHCALYRIGVAHLCVKLLSVLLT